MINYAVDPAVLKPIVPAGTELDEYQGRVFVSMVGFLFLSTRVFGLKFPFHVNFEEVNLRFYVRRRQPDGTWRRGAVSSGKWCRAWRSRRSRDGFTTSRTSRVP